MKLQEMAEVVKNNSNFPDSLEVVPFVYEEKGTVDSVVFEFDNVIVSFWPDGRYSVERS